MATTQLCCLGALLALCCFSSASGAWLWDLKIPKGNETYVANTTKTTTMSSSYVTKGPMNTTKAPAETAVAPSHPRPRSGKSSKTGSRVLTKKQPQNTTTSHPNPTDFSTSTTPQLPLTSTPYSANQMEPKIIKNYQTEVPVSPLQNPSTIVIVEPDSLGSGGYPPASYPQIYGAMAIPLAPYQPPVPFSALPPPPPPPPPYMSPYSPYPIGVYPYYQWQLESDYHRTHRSVHYPYLSPIGRFQFGGYQGPYSPFSYPWWRPYLPEPLLPVLSPPTNTIRTVNNAECTSGSKRDREEVTAEKTEKTLPERSEDTSPTYVSLLPKVAVKDTEPEVTKKETEKEIPIQEPVKQVAENVILRKSSQSGNETGVSPSYSPYAGKDNVDRETHILRNNPFQQSAVWPGVSQSQWSDWSAWQQWSPWTALQYSQPQGPQQYPYGFNSQPQQLQQYPHGFSSQPQQPQQYTHGFSSQPQQYPNGFSSQPPHPQQYPNGVPTQQATGQHVHKRQVENPRSRGS